MKHFNFTRALLLLAVLAYVMLMAGCMGMSGSGSGSGSGAGTGSTGSGSGGTGGGNTPPTPPAPPAPPAPPTPPAPPNPPTPPGDMTALNHIILMFQENRSFDHYFARLNTYRMAKGWGGANDVDTLDALSATPTNPADASGLVKWTSTNAASVSINGAAAGSTSGSMSVTPSMSTLYTAVATSSSGLTAAASVVIGTTPDSGDKTMIVGASPMKVAPGAKAMLTWATRDGSSLTITPPPDPQHTQAYGPNASATVTAPTTPGSVTYNFSSSSGITGSITLTVAAPAAGEPTITVGNDNQGHVSLGSAVNVASFKLTDQCVEDFSPDWLESHGAYNRDNPASETWLGNGFVHITAGFSQFANSTNDHHHYFDVRGARNMGYYDDQILPLYYFLASQFATSDRFFSPIPSNSPPNRFAELAATTAGYAHQPPQLNVKNIFELLDNAGVSWKVYYSDVSQSGVPLTTLTNFVWGAQHTDAKHLAPVDCTNATTPCAAGQTDYFSDLASGNFPAVVLIEPGFESGRDEHPGNPVQLGAVYDKKLIEKFMASPIWKDSVFFLTYDEAGGFYDHVQPMKAEQPDGIAPKDLEAKDPAGDFTRTGFRMPLIVMSPYTKPHFVSHQPSDTTALLKFIEQRFNLPNLTKRDAAQPPLDFFDFTKAAWATPPTLPDQPADAECAAYAKNP